MSARPSTLVVAAGVACAFPAVGCRSHKTVAPQVVPQKQATVTQPKPAGTHVASSKEDFVAPKSTSDEIPNDGVQATNLADQKGWIKDASLASDSSALSDTSQQNLQLSAKWIEAHPKFHVLVEGHCDERGTERYNLALGERRAYQAKEYLSTLGLDSHEINTISYGKEKPFDPGHSEDAWAQNRRAHIVLTAGR